MKRKYIVILFIVLISFGLIVGSYCIFNGIFPKAKPIRFPTVENISVVYTSYNSTNRSNVISDEDYVKLIGYINNAKPTRKQSLNDFPSSFPYYMIEIITLEKEYRYFIYEEGTQVFIEMPYEGIYISNIQLFNFVYKYKNNYS